MSVQISDLWKGYLTELKICIVVKLKAAECAGGLASLEVMLRRKSIAEFNIFWIFVSSVDCASLFDRVNLTNLVHNILSI